MPVTDRDPHRSPLRGAEDRGARGARRRSLPQAIPTTRRAKQILLGLPGAGADVIELGMPFSDPMADGPADPGVLAARPDGGAYDASARWSSSASSVSGTRTRPSCCSGITIRSTSTRPSAFWRMRSRPASMGCIVVDVPPEADEELCLPAIERGLNFIRLATPTTDAKRLPAVLANTSGFLYYVSITGITGTAAPESRRRSRPGRPVSRGYKASRCGGFWRKTPEQARAIASGADGVVVGSALVTAIKESLGAEGRSYGQDSVQRS